MRIFVVGADDEIGRQVLTRALARGHRVTDATLSPRPAHPARPSSAASNADRAGRRTRHSAPPLWGLAQHLTSRRP
ncbi:hypothetical protein [Streptomyces sp. NPDC006463]|uniref:hypothetical protein n=1 Tax=Streptomyces sp. NPDC006463 TaxID=3364746 RepID=UPI0036CCB7B7